MTTWEHPFGTQPPALDIQYNLSSLENGYSLKGGDTRIDVWCSPGEDLCVSCDNARGKHVVVTGPAGEVVKLLRQWGYFIRWEQEEDDV